VLVSDQIKNIVSAVGTIWLVMAIVLRSAPMALLFLVPNLFPIVLNFGLMGALGIPPQHRNLPDRRGGLRHHRR
jgi:predicted RND superfamily exporter protein